MLGRRPHPHDDRALISMLFFFFNDTATTEIYTLSLHDALPISRSGRRDRRRDEHGHAVGLQERSEEHTSELQSRLHLVCRLLLEKKQAATEQKSRRLDSHPPTYDTLFSART